VLLLSSLKILKMSSSLLDVFSNSEASRVLELLLNRNNFSFESNDDSNVPSCCSIRATPFCEVGGVVGGTVKTT
jgi:hypothetical protein